MSNKNIQSLVLDATPLITQSASGLLQHAEAFYTTPGVHSELRDDAVRQQLVLWGDKLNIRHPKQEFIDKVTSFAKLTGDFQVLSANDIHIIALSYELDVELNNGDERLRKYPGEKKENAPDDSGYKPYYHRKYDEPEEEEQPQEQEDDGWTTVIKPKKERKHRGGYRNNREQGDSAWMNLPGIDLGDKKVKDTQEPVVETVTDDKEQETAPQHQSDVVADKESTSTEETEGTEGTEGTEATEGAEELDEDYDEGDDDGEWITPENLQESMIRDTSQQMREADVGPAVKVAISTGDFACQNVALQIGLNLMNSISGRQIKRVRNYMYRCHACFRLTAIPKSGNPRHFCPKCGGNTLIRCAVSVDTETGRITPHLKANFQWHKRGNVYSLASPLSKNQIRLKGNGGYQHNKQNRHKSLQEPMILREDQKEYSRAVKDDEWQKRQNDKLLQEWVGGGSADNYMSPFGNSTVRKSGVKIGRGKYANATKKKSK